MCRVSLYYKSVCAFTNDSIRPVVVYFEQLIHKNLTINPFLLPSRSINTRKLQIITEFMKYLNNVRVFVIVRIILTQILTQI